MTEHFKFKDTGLPNTPAYKKATEVCLEWLNKNMSVFGEKRIADFMHNQPVAAAKRISNDTQSPSDQSIIVALLGPAKMDLLKDEKSSRKTWGDDVVDLIKHYSGQPIAGKQLQRDAVRLFLVEGLSTMQDQLIDRKRHDRHHPVRWNILNHLEKTFPKLKGQNPKIDREFEKALQASRLALETIDKNRKPKNPPKPPNHL